MTDFGSLRQDKSGYAQSNSQGNVNFGGDISPVLAPANEQPKNKPIHLGGRTLVRAQALQLLFQAEATGRTVEEVLVAGPALSDGPLDSYASTLAAGVDAERDLLDQKIENAATRWSVGRMPAVDRNVLRLALYEILYVDNIPAPVVIDEAVELAKIFSTDESGRFVNGVLGKIAQELPHDVYEGINAQQADTCDQSSDVYGTVDPDDFDTQIEADEVDAADASDAADEVDAADAAVDTTTFKDGEDIHG